MSCPDWGADPQAYNATDWTGLLCGSESLGGRSGSPEPLDLSDIWADDDAVLDDVPEAASSAEEAASSANPVPAKQMEPPRKRQVDNLPGNWRKYGQKSIKAGSDGARVRSYYRCTRPGCPAKKRVEIDPVGGGTISVCLSSAHNHRVGEALSASQGQKPLATPMPLASPDLDWNELLGNQHPHFVVCDPNLPDCPIVFASSGFCQLTGYLLHEVLGRNCRILQGKDTNPHTVSQLRLAIQRRREVHTTILNYRKDGSPFWNLLHLSPVQKDNKIFSYVGSQMDVTLLLAHAAGQQSHQNICTWRSAVNSTIVPSRAANPGAVQSIPTRILTVLPDDAQGARSASPHAAVVPLPYPSALPSAMTRGVPVPTGQQLQSVPGISLPEVMIMTNGNVRSGSMNTTQMAQCYPGLQYPTI